MQHLFDDPYIEDDSDELFINPNAPDAASKAPPVPVCVSYVTCGFGATVGIDEELILTLKTDRATGGTFTAPTVFCAAFFLFFRPTGLLFQRRICGVSASSRNTIQENFSRRPRGF